MCFTNRAVRCAALQAIGEQVSPRWRSSKSEGDGASHRIMKGTVRLRPYTNTAAAKRSFLKMPRRTNFDMARGVGVAGNRAATNPRDRFSFPCRYQRRSRSMSMPPILASISRTRSTCGIVTTSSWATNNTPTCPIGA